MQDYSKYKLQLRQALPLEEKILLTKKRIEDWYNYFDGNVYVSFSGGKDSTVLLHLVRTLYPDVKAIYSDTGLEFPENKEFAKTIENIEIIKPKKSFLEVIKQYGFPVVSKEQSQYISEVTSTKSSKLLDKRLNGAWSKKEPNKRTNSGKISERHKYLLNAPFKISHKCCYYLKKEPLNRITKEQGLYPFIGTMTEESRLREMTYIKNGCNAYNNKTPKSTPMAFWTEKDVWDYINIYELEYSKIYDKGYKRTGCMYCMYGIEKDDIDGLNRIQLLSKTHPKIYDYCINTLGLKQVLEFMNIKYEV